MLLGRLAPTASARGDNCVILIAIIARDPTSPFPGHTSLFPGHTGPFPGHTSLFSEHTSVSTDETSMSMDETSAIRIGLERSPLAKVPSTSSPVNLLENGNCPL